MCNICQFAGNRTCFSSDSRGNKNVPLIRLSVARDFDDPNLQKYGEFVLDTGADITIMSEQAAALLGIDAQKWETRVVLKSIHGTVLARKGHVSMRIQGVSVPLLIPVAVPLQSRGETRLLGREGLFGKCVIVICRDGYCIMQ